MAAIAFYAPMKSPTHPTPSGDRAMARGILQLLQDNMHGLNVVLASELRIYDGQGDVDVQNTLIKQANAKTERLITQGRAENWKAWVTYHNYYKAPDLIGPKVANTLGIPYVLLEATRAHKRLNGPWAEFAQLAETASDQADVIFYFTQQDKEALEKYQKNAKQQLCHLHPFLLQKHIGTNPRIKPQHNTLLSVGMMRKGAKTQSYAVIAKALKHLETLDWRLKVVGDGPNQAEIRSLFQGLESHISFLGKQDETALATSYTSASAFAWPGVDEAYGMVYLEAQAAGLPIIAQDRPGVCDVIAPDTALHAVDDPKAMAQAIDRLFRDDAYWQAQSQASLDHIAANHLQPKAAETLWAALTPLIEC